MELVIGSRKFTVKPHLIEKCGDTENVGFRAYDALGGMRQFQDLADMGEWMTSLVITETLNEEAEK